MSNSAIFAEPVKQWLRLHLRWEVGGGVMGFVSGVAVNTFFALGQFRTAEWCTALCLIVLLLWIWVLSLSALSRGIVAALMIGASILVIYKLDATRTQALTQEHAHKLAVLISLTINPHDRASRLYRFS